MEPDGKAHIEEPSSGYFSRLTK